MADVTLKPCPFCQGKAEIERMGNSRVSMIITCEDCGASLETGEEFLSDTCRWNTRPAPQPSEGDVPPGVIKASDLAKYVEASGYKPLPDDMTERFALAAKSKPSGDVELPPIDRDEGMNRDYIPIPGGWEIQTKGKGSTFRISDGKDQYPVTDTYLHKHLERMARDCRRAWDARLAASRVPDELMAALATLFHGYCRLEDGEQKFSMVVPPDWTWQGRHPHDCVKAWSVVQRTVYPDPDAMLAAAPAPEVTK